jgi:two-component system, OmpR family, phosphate regulon sensor histidine kinase PhoR
MKSRKNTVTILLMAASLSLLIILQIWWIHNSYEKAFSDFRRDTNIIFKNIVMDLRNRQWMKNMVQLNEDSLPVRMKIMQGDSVRQLMDSLREAGQVNREISVESKDDVYLGNADRTAHIAIRSKISRLRRDSVFGRPEGRSFIIRIDPDTIDTDTLVFQMQQRLAEAGISTPFAIRHLKPDRNFDMPVNPMADFIVDNHSDMFFASEREKRELKNNILSDTITTDAVRTSPLQLYGATFWNVRPFLVGRIVPQLVLSFLLTTLIVAAFIFMYRNLRTQERLMAAKNDFINNVTHELKTPVATVSVALEALQNFNAAGDARLTKEYLEIAQRELERLNEMTDRILKTSMLEKEIVITKESTDLGQIVARVLEDKKLLFSQRNATITLRKEEVDFPIHCDAHHLYPMVANLIDNGLKYSFERPVIDVELMRHDDTVVFSVTDQGIGIPKEYKHRIFEKFFRVPTGDVHTVKGYGLGLSYVYNVVRSLGGAINVESEPGKGARFVLRFPHIHVKEISFKIGKPRNDQN